MADDLTIFRYTEIAEDGVPVMNPLSDEKLDLLGTLAGLAPGRAVLDLGCGKGELLCRFAARHGITGVGVDIHPPFVALAQARAAELRVSEAVRFEVGDAGAHGVEGSFDVVACIGATWVGGGFAGSLALMSASLAPGGVLLVGEVFVEAPPPADAASRHGGTLAGLTDLGGLLSSASSGGFELEEMVLASRDDWDRYQSRQWQRASAWVRANPSHPDAAGVRSWTERSRRAYLADERSWMGWGVFVLRPSAA